MANRQGRVKAIIGKDISDIVFLGIKNPKIGMVSVNEVKVNDDYSLANVYVSFFDDNNVKERFKELKNSEGFVRKELAKRVDIYKVPKVNFILDDSFTKADSLERALKKEQEQIDKLSK